MKKLLTVFFLLFLCIPAKAQPINELDDLKIRISLIEDRIAIKEVVDVFSILADKKDVPSQILLFTENALVETYIDGKLATSLQGRKQIGEAFQSFLNTFETVYHINGQQTVTINGNEASGISYCMVTLIGIENGKRMKTSIGVYYNDDYVRENSRWLISKRKSTFEWREKSEL